MPIRIGLTKSFKLPIMVITFIVMCFAMTTIFAQDQYHYHLAQYKTWGGATNAAAAGGLIASAVGELSGCSIVDSELYPPTADELINPFKTAYWGVGVVYRGSKIDPEDPSPYNSSCQKKAAYDLIENLKELEEFSILRIKASLHGWSDYTGTASSCINCPVSLNDECSANEDCISNNCKDQSCVSDARFNSAFNNNIMNSNVIMIVTIGIALLFAMFY